MTFSDLRDYLEGDEIVLRVYDDYNTDYLIQEMTWCDGCLGDPYLSMSGSYRDCDFYECEVMSIFPFVEKDSNGKDVLQIIVEVGYYSEER